MNKRIAVIDVGSNTIKILVAEAGEPIEKLHISTRETRLGMGISAAEPRLCPERMKAGVTSILELLEEAKPFAPQDTIVVATSAVRDAVNREEFLRLVKAETGMEIQVLTGIEEAEYTCEAVARDPLLAEMESFTIVDLGGGSMEVAIFSNGGICSRQSFPLGAVRVAEHFSPCERGIFSENICSAISKHINDCLLSSPALIEAARETACLVGTGGALYFTRRLMAGAPEYSLDAKTPFLGIGAMKDTLRMLAAMTQEERCALSFIPPSRADILPCALATLIALAEKIDAKQIVQSFQNLRYGVALAKLSDA